MRENLKSNNVSLTNLTIIRVRGYPLNGIFGPCARLLAGGYGAWRLLARHHRHRRRGCFILCRYHLGDPKIDEKLQTPQDTCSKNPGGDFWGGAEAPQAVATQPQRALGHLKSLKNNKIHKIHTPKLQGLVFSEVAEASQAAATQTHGAGRP